MKVIVWNTKEKILRLETREEPQIQAADEIKLQVLQVGICGTDREEVSHNAAVPPSGKSDIVLGHEMLGKVIAVGSSVTQVKKGDLAIFSVRRGCSQCPACEKGLADLCYTGNYTERGIFGRDGFQAEYVVDQEKYVVKVPKKILSCGVLCEPMSIVQKGLDQMIQIQKKRLPDWRVEGKRFLVAGIGTIGLLTAAALLLRGARVWGYDRIDSESSRVQLLKKMGGEYVSVKKESLPKEMDGIFEATGNAQLCFDLIASLGANGAYVLLGVSQKNREVKFDGGTAVHQMVLKNQLLLGSVNAAHSHWKKALEDLATAKKRWGNLLDSLITNEYTVEEFEKAFFKSNPNEIKSIIRWGNG